MVAGNDARQSHQDANRVYRDYLLPRRNADASLRDLPRPGFSPTSLSRQWHIEQDPTGAANGGDVLRESSRSDLDHAPLKVSAAAEVKPRKAKANTKTRKKENRKKVRGER
jgi:hypothetical protein